MGWLMKSYKTKNMNLQLFAGETITDLTGTSWELNDNISTAPSGWNFADENENAEHFEVRFYSNGEECYNISFDDLENAYSFNRGFVNYFNGRTDVNVYNTSFQWTNEAYRIIEITGGTDATNQDLISWLQTNATQIQSGYSSVINLTNCTCNKSSESGLSGSYSATITANDGYYLAANAIVCSDQLAIISIGETKKQAIVEIDDVTEDFTITAQGTLKTVQNVILHPNNDGVTDYTTEMYPEVNSATNEDIQNLFN